MLYFILVISAFFFFVRAWLLHHYGHSLNRAQVTGGELARYVFDSSGYPSVTVDSQEAQRGEPQGTLRRFTLPASLYHGRSIVRLAEASLSAYRFMKDPDFFFAPALRQFLNISVRICVLASWVLLWTGSGGMASGTGAVFCKAVLGTVFLWGMVRLSRDEPSHAYLFRLFQESRYFGVDELVRLRKVLKGIRFGPPAWAILMPVDLVSGFFAGRIKKRHKT